MSDSQWYLIHSKARQEHTAELNLQRLGIETFCPRARKLTRRIGHYLEEILFPGYLFIRTNITTDYRKVTYAQGVLRVVKFGSLPAVVEEEIIESIKARAHDGCVILPFRPSLKYGQIVQMNRGPLNGWEAIFEQELNGGQRVALLMKKVAFQGHLVVDLNCVGLP